MSSTNFEMRKNDGDILQFWQTLDIYDKLKQKNKGKPKYNIHNIPYPARNTGAVPVESTLDAAHLKKIILKDMFLKYKAMSDSDVSYSPSWDCYHPVVERNVLKEIGEDTEDISPVRIRELCRRDVLREIDSQRTQFQRLGVFANWRNAQTALEARSESKTLDVFGKLYEMGYISRADKPAYWCIRCKAILSDEELKLAHVDSTSAYIKFPLCEGLEEFGENVHFLVWVSDLWLVLTTQAVGICDSSEYAVVEKDGEVLILASERLKDVFKRYGCRFNDEVGDYQVLSSLDASTLAKCLCSHPLLDLDLPVIVENHLVPNNNEGTGVFSISPAYNEEHYKLISDDKFNITHIADDSGRLTDEARLFCGVDVSEAGEFITFELEKRNLIALTFPYKSLRPHCWICGMPAIFRPSTQWFFSSSSNKLQKRVAEAIDNLNWIPETDKQQLQKVIENLGDWCISRQRAWGISIPVFYCEKCGHQLSVARSVTAARDMISRKGIDAWFRLPAANILPKNTTCNHCGSKNFQQERCVLNNNFNSVIRNIGYTRRESSATATVVYLEEAEDCEKWLYHLIPTSMAIDSTIHFRNLSTFCIQEDANQNPSSVFVANNELPRKRDTEENQSLAQLTSGECSADILRLWYISKEPIEKLTKACNEIETACSTILAILTDFEPANASNADDYQVCRCVRANKLDSVDRLALEELDKLISQVNSEYSACEFFKGFNKISEFCQTYMNGFYLKDIEERSCSPGWREVRTSAQTALWNIAYTIAKLIAPLTSFLAEGIWANLRKHPDAPASVFLDSFPMPKENHNAH